jgi:hypothetical protein
MYVFHCVFDDSPYAALSSRTLSHPNPLNGIRDGQRRHNRSRQCAVGHRATSLRAYAKGFYRPKRGYSLKSKKRQKLKSKVVFETFLSENQIRPPSLRSGSVCRLAEGEHRILAMGEDLPFDITLGPIRHGGLSVIRKIISGSEIMALKTLQANVDESEFRKELAIHKALRNVHVCSAVASLKDLSSRFHIVFEALM